MFDTCLYFNANRLARAVNRLWEDAYSEFELAPAHAYLLRLVLAKPGLIQKHIAEELALDKSTVNRFVDKMEKEGYLYRTLRDDDRRIGVFPTPECEDIRVRLNEINEELNAAIHTLLGKNLLSQVLNSSQETYARL